MKKQIKLYSVDTRAFYNEEEEKLNAIIAKESTKINMLKKYEIIKYAYEEMEKNHNPKDKKSEKPKYKITNFEDFEKKYKITNVKKYIKNILGKNKDYEQSKELKEVLMKNEYYNEWMDSERKTKTYEGKKSKLNIIKAELEKLITNEKNKSFEKFINNIEQTRFRKLNEKKLNKHTEISTTDNALLQAIGAVNIVTDIIVVRVLYYDLIHQLILDGFIFNNEKYIFYTASSGQIRQKKVVFIKESKLNEVLPTLTCGLTREMINVQGGMTINKYLAYMALTSTDTTEWDDFDITKAIVIPDFEQEVKGKFDYIKNIDNVLQVPELNQEMAVKIPFSDGCGMYLPRKEIKNKNFQFRMPWFKGLLTPVDYIGWCDKYNNRNYKVKDIYKKEWDLKKDDIKYIFTESQFKMHRYYKDWTEYQNNFIKYKCQAGKCNEEGDTFKRPRFCYQMWQTLTDITDEEIKHYTDKIDTQITNAYTDRNTMLKMMGITEDNAKKSYLQRCLEIYPELLQDSYINSQLSDNISKKRKNAKSGKFTIDGASTFILPDIFSWLQWMFLKDKTQKVTGLLKNGQVFCKLFDTNTYPKLVVNRSPHLYREHGLRDNVSNKDMKKWFITNGIYTSCHDTLSLLLMFDVDGDHATIFCDQYLCNIVERNMKGVNPLYYKMSNAKAEIITNESIYKSITKAFSSGNIGNYSNKITRLWNKNDFTDDTLTCIKVLTAMNNYSIDSAKTMEMPTLSRDLKQLMKREQKYKITEIVNGKKVTKRNTIKLPYFFRFAKNNNNTENINSCTVNRICTQIKGIKRGEYNYKSLGKFNKNILLHSKNIISELDKEKIKIKSAKKLYGKDGQIVRQIQSNIEDRKEFIKEKMIMEYEQLNKQMQIAFSNCSKFGEEESKEQKAGIIYQDLKKELDTFCVAEHIDIIDAVDAIVRYIFTNKQDQKKAFLFNVLGEYILCNIKENIEIKYPNTIMCVDCGKRVVKTSNRTIRCKECADARKKEQDRLRKSKK